jgi:hypothetical protein
VGRESREVTIAFQGSRQRDVGKGSSQDAVGQSVDNVAVRTQIVLVFVLLGLVPLVSSAVRTASCSAGLTRALQQAVLEVVEGAHAWRVVGLEAAAEGVEAVVAHHPDPDREAGDAAEHHGQTRAEHGDRLTPQASQPVRIEGSQEGIGMVQVGLFQLLPDVVVPMVGAQATVAARIGKRRANIALVRNEWWYHE